METLQDAKEVKAIKEHRCDLCAEKIVVGTVYMNSTHVDQDQIYNWKTHKWCAKIASAMRMYDDVNEGVTADDFQERIGDKYIMILCDKLDGLSYDNISALSGELSRVPFRDKLWFVIRHYNKLNPSNK